ncbi:DUF3073 domain-containing protein [Arthrobacter roseus]|uniref:DUF3073 domain-containing protein n=1 Tax=Arthrobacter roseus TaxID=136274 RepID=UPI001966C9A4|nr:DUF3073 domain-containing protein [Arthrobacter roseus]MBM7849679.1 hypothetical protein [Arthrobacter roseus]
MGRGRQKAKATKQARDIKYFSPATDYSALQRELDAKGHSSSSYAEGPPEPDYSDYADKYADTYVEEEEDGTRRIG